MSDMHILTFKHFEVKIQNTGKHVFLGISVTEPGQQAISTSQVLPPEVVAQLAAMLESAAREGEGLV